MKARFLPAALIAALLPSLPAAAQEASAEPKPEMPEVPADVAAPPADAEKSESGLAWKVLKEGDGGEKPGASDTVTVHYSGWTTDGEMFDSSMERGQPATFGLGQVIKGWTEGVQLMEVGEKRRFWIPEDLAYGPKVEGSPRPGGMLVFDVELLEVKAAPKVPEDVSRTEGGVAYKLLAEGEGEETPGGEQIVEFHFVGKTMEGQTVQDSRQAGQPVSLNLAAQGVPAELVEVLTGMNRGEKRQVWLPQPQLPGGHIEAEIELLSFKDAPEPPAVPEDVGAVPEGAEKSESGLAWKVLEKGEGGAKPKASSTVKVHYSGWTTDGEMFDSSVTRDEPATFPLNGVIQGWTEGVQLMEVGEKRRFWIPEDLAYGPKVEGSPRPGGMLVFDIELLEIME